MANGWRRVGLIVNPSAGQGAAQSMHAARNAIERLGAQEVFTGRGQMGATALLGWSGQAQVHDLASVTGREETRALARWIAERNADAVIVVGGDGTLSDVAQVCFETESRLPILGIGTGSTNAGRLITCRATRSQELDPDELEFWNADCLFATVDGRLLGLGFNDVVIGHTVVGIINGERRDLDAAERMQENAVTGVPRRIGNRRTRVTRSAPGLTTLLAEGESVGTVVAGFAEPAFFGKAVSGGVCLTTLAGLPAGCLVCDTPLVQVGIAAETVLNAPPVISTYVSLSDGVSIAVERVNEGAALCVDGNPLRLLTESDRVVISVRRRVVVGVRANKDMRSA
ncbi:MAG: diacylglycerol kinase family protein, partial [Blastocatellia bacterium]